MDVHHNRHLMLKPYRCPHTDGEKEPNHVPENPNPQCPYQTADPSALKKHREHEHGFKPSNTDASHNGTPREVTPSDDGLTIEVQTPSSPTLLSPDEFTPASDFTPGGAVRRSRSSSRARFSPYPPSSPVEASSTSSDQALDSQASFASCPVPALLDSIVFPVPEPALPQPSKAAADSNSADDPATVAAGASATTTDLGDETAGAELADAQPRSQIDDLIATLRTLAAEPPSPAFEDGFCENALLASPASPRFGTASYDPRVELALLPDAGANDLPDAFTSLHAGVPPLSPILIPRYGLAYAGHPGLIEPGWSPAVIAEASRLENDGPPTWEYFNTHIMPHI
ncbi:hypothetical protein PsYK624_067060 [Phanerochaete sordida]|uniref:Uncharacterized protein n=1 Tax=Phanerochaete sordida TaxID=48140 RepID=A0A9P3G937_9APHY|nr:hypothetical protein PsYK624_067060 [Phanerochaete sordida]